MSSYFYRKQESGVEHKSHSPFSTPNGYSPGMSRASMSKELRKIDNARRAIRRYKKIDIRKMSMTDKYRYELAKKLVATASTQAYGEDFSRGRDLTNIDSKQSNEIRDTHRRTHKKTPEDLNIGLKKSKMSSDEINYPYFDLVNETNNIQTKSSSSFSTFKDYYHLASRSTLSRESNGDHEYLSRDERKQVLINRIESARRAVHLDYERLSSVGRSRLEFAKNVTETLTVRNIHREDERARSRDRLVSARSRSHKEERQEERRTRWKTPERLTSSNGRRTISSDEINPPYIDLDKESDEESRKSSSSVIIIEDSKGDQEIGTNNGSTPLANRIKNLKRSIQRCNKMDYEKMSINDKTRFESAKKMLTTLRASTQNKICEEGPSIVTPATDTLWSHTSKGKEKPQKTSCGQHHSKTHEMVVNSSKGSSNGENLSHLMPGNAVTMTICPVADFWEVPKDNLQASVENLQVDGSVQKDYLQVAVVDGFNPGRQLVEDQWAYVERKLLFCLDEMLIRSSGPYPIFDQLSTIKGYKILACCNDFTLQWLKARVNEMAPPWMGARLNVVAKKDLPTGPLVRIYLPGPPISKNRLQQFIRNLNPEFPSEDWRVMEIQDNQNDNGQEGIVMLNDKSMGLLPEREFKVRVGISVVRVWPIDESSETPAGESA